MVLLSIALVAIFELFSANLRGIAKSDDYSHAVMLAQSKMRDILDNEDLAERAWTETNDEGYRFDTLVKETARERTENLQIRLLDINLKVSWTKDTKERSLTSEPENW